MNDDIHALSGAYAVDALDDVERARFERHLAGCPDCRSEVDSLTEAAAELSVMMPLAPPAALRDKVMRDITMVRPLPPLSPAPSLAQTGDPAVEAPATIPGHPGPARTPTRWRGLVAAAAAVVLTIGGFTVWRSLDQGAPPPTVAEQVLDAPDASRISQTFPGGASASIVRSPSLHRAVIVTSKMPAAPAGKVYQLWLQSSSGHMSPAGLMPPGADQVVALAGDATTATAAGVTIEPAGGSQQPTTKPIALFAFS